MTFLMSPNDTDIVPKWKTAVLLCICTLLVSCGRGEDDSPISMLPSNSAQIASYSTLGDWNYMSSSMSFTQLQDVSQQSSTFVGFQGSESIPTGSATWTGDMVSLDSNNKVFRGGASIRLTNFGNPRVDVQLTPQSHAEIVWRNLPVKEGSYSGRQSSSDYVSGGFYGPNSEETGGEFKRDGLFGVFGAKR